MSLLQMSFLGTVIILLIVVLRAVLINRLPKKTFLILWWIALIRLLVPFSIKSVTSIYSLLQSIYSDINPVRTAQTTTFLPIHGNMPEIANGLSEAMVQRTESISILSVIWLAGLLLCFGFFAVSYIKCYREFRFSLPVENDILEAWKEKHPLKRSLSIRQTETIAAPLSYGVIRPVILMPKNTEWKNIYQLRYVLEHEYVHIRRLDMLTKLIMIAAVCIHWFNPLVWVAAHFHKEDCELFCDEAVIRNRSASERQKYGEVLLNAAARHSGRLSDIYLLSGASSGYRELKKRIERIAGSRKTYKSAAFVLVIIVVAVTVLAFGGGSVKGSSKLPESGIETDTQKDNNKMQNYLVTEYKYDLTHDGVDDVVSMEVYGYAADINNVDEALKDTRKYVTVTVKDGVTGQNLYTKEVGNSHSQNGFVSIVSENGQYYIMDGIKGVWQGDGIERFTVYDFSTGTKNVVGECKVDYYASEESAERAANRGQLLVSQQEADEMYNSRIARWNDGAVVLIECLIY